MIRLSKESKALELSEDTDTLLRSNTRVTKEINNASENETDANLDVNVNEMASCVYNTKVPQDIYAIIITPSSKNVYITVFFVFLFQIIVLSLLLSDLFTYPKGSPPLNAPAGVTDNVRVSQFFAIIIAIVLQEDIITSLDMITNMAVMKDVPISPLLYIASSIFRIIVGFLGLIVSFVITIQSSSTIQLFADFAAMAFISSIDNIIYILACNGYFSEKVEKQANAMKNLSMRALSKPAYWIRRTVLFVLFLILTTAWVIITVKQRRGDFVCSSITIEMNLDIEDYYSFFNGIYKKSEKLFNERVVYYEENFLPNVKDYGAHPNLGFTGAGRFQYCAYLGKWIFATPYTETDSYEYNPCGSHFQLTSQRTDTFDLMAVNPSDWVTWDGKEASFERYFCNECNDWFDCNGGDCHNKICNCSRATGIHQDDFYNATAIGPCCNLLIKCDKIIVINEASSGFGDSYCEGNQNTTSPYSLLESDAPENFVYGRPVYTKDCFNATGARIAMSYVMFVGNRWIISRTNETESELIKYIDTFHADSAWTSDFESSYTASGSPIDVNWHHFNGILPEEISDSFICSLNCKNTNICGDEEGRGKCVVEPYEFCSCNHNDTHIYVGEYCQYIDYPQRDPLTTYDE